MVGILDIPGLFGLSRLRRDGRSLDGGSLDRRRGWQRILPRGVLGATKYH